MQNLKKDDDTNELMCKTGTDSQTLRMNLWLLGEGQMKATVREFRSDMYTLIYLKWISSKIFLYSTGNSYYYMAAWVGGEFGRERIHVYLYTYG